MSNSDLSKISSPPKTSDSWRLPHRLRNPAYIDKDKKKPGEKVHKSTAAMICDEQNGFVCYINIQHCRQSVQLLD